MSNQLLILREEISEIDTKILELLTRRMILATSVAEYKHIHGLPIFDPVRENELLSKYAKRVDFNIGPIYQSIMDESKRLQSLHLQK